MKKKENHWTVSNKMMNSGEVNLQIPGKRIPFNGFFRLKDIHTNHKKHKYGKSYLSGLKSATETVFPAQKVELVTGCYLNGVPC